MNYCVLNGIKSNTVKGLLIQALPPISKPLIRTEIQQIDGRDGDIVTKLGYSSYNKEMRIGLFGNFDVDHVISFFDSEGKVTFSNEPDKYYNYQIIEQIDFERLIRFREATVIFHVQPFKYSDVGDDVLVDASNATSTALINIGNTISKPTIELLGSGDIELSINDNQVLSLSLGNDEQITIDAGAMNAYQGELLMNRSVTGDYGNVILNPGPNTLSWSGEVQTVEITKISRWI